MMLSVTSGQLVPQNTHWPINRVVPDERAEFASHKEMLARRNAKKSVRGLSHFVWARVYQVIRKRVEGGRFSDRHQDVLQFIYLLRKSNRSRQKRMRRNGIHGKRKRRENRPGSRRRILCFSFSVFFFCCCCHLWGAATTFGAQTGSCRRLDWEVGRLIKHGLINDNIRHTAGSARSLLSSWRVFNMFSLATQCSSKNFEKFLN